MNNIEDGLEDIIDITSFKDDVKNIKTEIKIATIKLQEDLKKAELVLKQKKNINQITYEKLWNDKSNHIMIRYKLWEKYSQKSSGDYIIDEGPLRNLCEGERYQTIYVLDQLSDAFDSITWDYHETKLYDFMINEKRFLDELSSAWYNEDLDKFEDLRETFLNVGDSESIEDFGELMKKITAIYEDGIKQNVEDFVWDW